MLARIRDDETKIHSNLNDSKHTNNRLREKKLKFISCNLCGKNFKTKSNFERFCQECKIENEDYIDYEFYNRF